MIDLANEHARLKQIIGSQIRRLMHKFPDHWRPCKYQLINPENVIEQLARDAEYLGIKNPMVLLAPGTSKQFSVRNRAHFAGIENDPVYKKINRNSD